MQKKVCDNLQEKVIRYNNLQKSETNSQKIAVVVKFANNVIQIGNPMGKARVQLLLNKSPKYKNCVFPPRETCFSRKRESFGGLSLLN